jgi:hypothetical protein
VIITRTRLVSTRRVKFPHAECVFHTLECNFDILTLECDLHTHCDFDTQKIEFYTQSVISTHTIVILTLTSVITTLTSVITTRSSVIYALKGLFLHGECNINTLDCDYNTHNIGFYTQSKISTRRV